MFFLNLLNQPAAFLFLNALALAIVAAASAAFCSVGLGETEL